MLLKLAILISGRGSNMRAILRAIKKQNIPIVPTVVISNKPSARGLRIARGLDVKTEIVESKGFQGSRWEYDQKIIGVLNKYGVMPKNSLICLAGFMRILSPEFIKKFKNRILNIHPSILPAFPGLDAQRQAIESGVSHSGCTVHFVDEGVDTGQIIVQETVKIKNDDTEETLSKRILAKEHKAYVKAVKLIAEKKINVTGRKVKFLA
ncbi:phosphoribosylglycinamide formyltransferase [Marine Group I thaumarchaeote]|jgi:phosphoribosylglycinamide formyltransferase-1|uniref:phosphoribosylglycinamide formyltransferase 1 n=4 Tax=Nitrososphaerota TaxID=651137 RepID=A0A7K4MYK6_9ARCH|nr:putative Formyl transferase [uncultured marine crenarchaeote HF4000_APKG5N21]NWJ68143.1 phosphoribosylglycinamide formyltransferase [Marine Group I thaumarchaeote]